MDETIRSFIRQYKVARVRDIKSELTEDIRAKLTEKFAGYGVYIE